VSQAVVLQIGEVARRAGVSLRTVRHYEEVGLLPPWQRTSAGTRLYSEADVVRLRFIRRLKAWGLSLEEIEIALGDRQSAQSRADRVNHTLEVLLTEQRHAEEQLAAFQRLREEVEDALVNVRLCATCAAEDCPPDCERLADLL
jgi:DNA-binding transcriptional MerR regulator